MFCAKVASNPCWPSPRMSSNLGGAHGCCCDRTWPNSGVPDHATAFREFIFLRHGAFNSGDGFLGFCKNVFSGGRFSRTPTESADSHARRSVHIVDAAADNTDIASGGWPGGYSPEAGHRRFLSCVLDGGAGDAG